MVSRNALLAVPLLQAVAVSASNVDYTSHVNVFWGASTTGNDFPGASRPWGMVKNGPDLWVDGTDSYSGFLVNGNFSGFSLMHEQGTGGAPKYGTVSQLPLLGNVSQPLSNLTIGRSGTDHGSVGYYNATTAQGVEVELSAAARAGIYRYTFPAKSEAHVLVDVSHVLPSYRGMNLSQHYEGGSIRVFSDGHYEGHGTYNNGWNEAPNWTIYFCGYFDTPATKNTTYSATEKTGSIAQPNGYASSTDRAIRVGSLFTFRNVTQVTSRVGISWMSTEKACKNLHDEIPKGTSLDTVVKEAKAEWNDKILSKITINSTNETSLSLLYSSLYFMSLIPTNQTGENPGWNSTEPYYQDFFTFWDLFRCSTSLWHVLQPTFHEEVIRSLIDIWRHVGYMPDARSSNYNGRSQGGSNADNILADAYVKGVRGAVNWDDGWQAMVKDAEITPPNYPVDWLAPDSSTHDGRSALPDWKTLGYITTRFSRSVSRAVDYAANDFGLYQVALGMEKKDYVEKYLNRSRNWRNHWNPDATSLGFSGFVVPINESGFMPYNMLTSDGYWTDPYYEASAWEYSWTDVHDMAEMIKMMGGRETTIKRLETMFIPGADGTSGSIIYDPTNEPTFNVPYLFNFLDRQDLSVNYSRSIAKTYYTSGIGGLPGESDAGAMQTWLLWNMIGLYPLTGQTTFLIHSPWFDSMTIDLGGGKELKITSTGGDGNGDSDFYVQSLKVNGKAWKKNWLTWDDVFSRGGTLEFELGATAVNWTDGELPPSPAS
ncbi:hypothetical protein ASPZODRAFT_11648 [Penicilliopsis zonata CBS 506.65]|uniref:Glycosyl hydrolase family 92 domain-containing protein n=1 Tax=Penicilliopsis zonata CBS 506.65 TaxID=1073090 RepID=A0A1L9SUC4_9EURO|nr:hypothetical protein ASPZODRAFT_11648 [Penicilliopsis zonata CBS 506.65]OJJ50798.1 hypothetical protein ASPZODRAFT_11648 [Penicilliopsis zonata CBS 506.65]